GAYFALYRRLRARQHALGEQYDRHHLDQQRVAQEGLGGVKELLVLGRQRHPVERFAAATRGAESADFAQTLTAHLPRYALETLAFGGILIVTLLMVARDEAVENVVPALALYAFAGYRLMPALQQIFASVLEIR